MSYTATPEEIGHVVNDQSARSQLPSAMILGAGVSRRSSEQENGYGDVVGVMDRPICSPTVAPLFDLSFIVVHSELEDGFSA